MPSTKHSRIVTKSPVWLMTAVFASSSLGEADADAILEKNPALKRPKSQIFNKDTR